MLAITKKVILIEQNSNFYFRLKKNSKIKKNIFVLEFEIRCILDTLYSSEYSRFIFNDEAFTQNLF